jgi:hypothetical protein
LQPLREVRKRKKNNNKIQISKAKKEIPPSHKRKLAPGVDLERLEPMAVAEQPVVPLRAVPAIETAAALYHFGKQFCAVVCGGMYYHERMRLIFFST